MRQLRPLPTVVLGAISLGLSGCAVLLVGAGAAGGYAIGRDSITNHFDLPQDRVFRASREVIGELGLVTTEDARHGLIKAQVEGANVTITVKRISETTVELKVKARNDLFMPKIRIAQTVYTHIADRLR